MRRQPLLLFRSAYERGRVLGQNLLTDEVARECPKRGQTTRTRGATDPSVVKRSKKVANRFGGECLDRHVCRRGLGPGRDGAHELRDVRIVRAQRVRRHIAVVTQELEELARVRRQHAGAGAAIRDASVHSASWSNARRLTASCRSSRWRGGRSSGGMMPNVMFEGA